MKLLLDQGLPRSAAGLLRARSVDAVHVAERGWSANSDVMLLDAAQREGRVIVSLNGDFHDWLAVSRAAGPSVIRIRIEGLRAEALVALITNVLAATGDRLMSGSLVSVSADSIRVRSLPVR